MEQEKVLDQDRVLSKVRGLLAKAESLGPDNPEGKACQERADAMMEQYAIDQAQLRESAPAAGHQKPGTLKIDLIPVGSPYEDPVSKMVMVVAEYCRCKPVFHRMGLSADRVAQMKEWYGDNVMSQVTVAGFEYDLRYFEMLFTNIHLHMASGYDPKVNWSASDEDNAYALHNAGLNWRAIARAFGPSHPMGWDGVLRPDGGHLGRAGSYWKACYRRATLARGEGEIRIAKFGDSNERKVIEYRYNFAMSYVSTIRLRFDQIKASRVKTGEIVLARSMDRITEFMSEMFPDLETIGFKFTPGYNAEAWKAGNVHGQAADLDASSRVSNKQRPGIA